MQKPSGGITCPTEVGHGSLAPRRSPGETQSPVLEPDRTDTLGAVKESPGEEPKKDHSRLRDGEQTPDVREDSVTHNRLREFHRTSSNPWI